MKPTATGLFRDHYPGKEAYVFTSPLKYPSPWLNPLYQPRTIEKGNFVRDNDNEVKEDDEE